MKVLHTLVIFYKGVQTPLKMFNYLTTSEQKRSKNVQSVTIAYIFRFCTFRCMSNPDLIILTHESAAYTRHILQRCANTIEMCSILITSEHQAQQECTECNHCVHLSILHIQMHVKSWSNHTHSWKCCIHSSYFTKVCKHNRNVQYFENVRAPSAARMYRV